MNRAKYLRWPKKACLGLRDSRVVDFPSEGRWRGIHAPISRAQDRSDSPIDQKFVEMVTNLEKFLDI